MSSAPHEGLPGTSKARFEKILHRHKSPAGAEAQAKLVTNPEKLWENSMSKVIVGLTISLDGYVNDSSGSVDALYSDFETFRKSEPLIDNIQKTGAAVMGRNTYAMCDDPDWWAYNYEYQVPIFVVTHEIPTILPRETDKLSFTFVRDGVESAIQQAKLAANGMDVSVIGGVSTLRQCIQAGLADELHLDIMPIVLCGGLRLFEDFGMAPIQLERLEVTALAAGRTHLKFRIIK